MCALGEFLLTLSTATMASRYVFFLFFESFLLLSTKPCLPVPKGERKCIFPQFEVGGKKRGKKKKVV